MKDMTELRPRDPGVIINSWFFCTVWMNDFMCGLTAWYVKKREYRRRLSCRPTWTWKWKLECQGGQSVKLGCPEVIFSLGPFYCQQDYPIPTVITIAIDYLSTIIYFCNQLISLGHFRDYSQFPVTYLANIINDFQTPVICIGPQLKYFQKSYFKIFFSF